MLSAKTYEGVTFLDDDYNDEYEVSYKLKSGDKSIDMTDYIVFKVMKMNPSVIEEVSIDKGKSSIFNEFKNSKIN